MKTPRLITIVIVALVTISMCLSVTQAQAQLVPFYRWNGDDHACATGLSGESAISLSFWNEVIASCVGKNMVTVLLTFDDGPEGDEYGFNSTVSVLDTLNDNNVQSEIKAIFFTLTHGPQWGGSQLGEDLLKRERTDGHVSSIHGGGKGASSPHLLFGRHTWRASSTTKPYPIGSCGEVLKEGNPIGRNALESDLVAAIRRLKCIYADPNYNPEFVRPPGYFYNDNSLEAYNSQAVKCELGNCDGDGLKMILSNNQGIGDAGGPGPPPFLISKTLRASVKNCLQRKIYDIVLTLHDSNNITARNLVRYLNEIRLAAEEEGYAVRFVVSAVEARTILNKRWSEGNWQWK